MNTYQAQQTLNVTSDATLEEIKLAYRKMALEHHPDKNSEDFTGIQFKKITEAYHHLRKEHKEGKIQTKTTNTTYKEKKTQQGQEFKRAKWGAGPQDKVPEEDWSKFTKEFEEGDPSWWKEYERRFWEEYNAHIHPNDGHGEFEKAKEPKMQPNLFVDVDKSLCIGCCSCEIIAPDVFEINKNSKMNPKSSVINPKGAGVNKIMNAAETCPTRAIIVENEDTNERMYPI